MTLGGGGEGVKDAGGRVGRREGQEGGNGEGGEGVGEALKVCFLLVTHMSFSSRFVCVCVGGCRRGWTTFCYGKRGETVRWCLGGTRGSFREKEEGRSEIDAPSPARVTRCRQT
jgi:hypothetical protein